MTDPVTLVVTADDAFAVKVCAALAGESGDSPEVFRTAAHAMRVLLDGRPDDRCVILDVPDAAALAALADLLRRLPALPVIVAVGDDATAGQALRAGAQDHLARDEPIDAAELHRSRREAVDRSHAVRALVDSNRQLGSFAGLVAHDLRSPLAITTGMLQLLERKGEGVFDEDLRFLLSRAINGARRATDLTAAMLDHARASQPDDEVHDVDLDEAFATTRSSIELPDGADLAVDTGSITVRVNEASLRHVLQNLLGNAVQFADPDRALRIRVDHAVVDDRVELRIADNGIGIPTESRTRALDPGETLGRDGAGAGLGLATAAVILRRYGCEPTVGDGLDGHGVSVTIALPIAVGAESS